MGLPKEGKNVPGEVGDSVTPGANSPSNNKKNSPVIFLAIKN
jgi:hypothetical protein